jgi:site-specific DNA-methyltransferase (adenine-specific)
MVRLEEKEDLAVIPNPYAEVAQVEDVKKAKDQGKAWLEGSQVQKEWEKYWDKKTGKWVPLEKANRTIEVAALYYRRAGELLRDMQKNPGVQTKGGGTGAGGLMTKPPANIPRITDYGISKFQSHQFQLAAEVPIEEIAKMRATADEKHAYLTLDKVYKRGKELRRERMRNEVAKRGASSPKKTDQYELIHGDCLKVCLAMKPASVNVIITDPPYGKNAIDCYSKLGELAKHVLKPGGCVFAFGGQYHLADMIAALGEHLTYHWTMAYFMPGGHATRIWARQVNAYWKPILWFAKGKHKASWFTDVIQTTPNQGGERHSTDRKLHKWGQNLEGMMTLVTRVSKAGQMVLDPFCGAGSIGLAATSTGRKYIGIDTVKKNINISAARLGDKEAGD